MADFIGLYRGKTVSDAELVAICAEPRIVRLFTDELLGEDAGEAECSDRKLAVIRGQFARDDEEA